MPKKRKISLFPAGTTDNVMVDFPVPLSGDTVIQLVALTCAGLRNTLHQEEAEDGTGYVLGQTSDNVTRHLQVSPEVGNVIHPDGSYQRVVLTAHKWPYTGEMTSKGATGYALAAFAQCMNTYLSDYLRAR